MNHDGTQGCVGSTLDAAIAESVARRGTARRTDIIADLGRQGMNLTIPHFYAAIGRLRDRGVISIKRSSRGMIYSCTLERATYEWHGFGMVIRFPEGTSVWLQGDEACQLHDELGAVTDPEVLQVILSGYRHIAE